MTALPRRRKRHALPGFGLSLGVTLTYLGLLVVIPLSTVVIETCSMTAAEFWRAISSQRAIAAYELSIGASLLAATINVAMGTLVAWVLVRYDVPGRRLVDAMIDLPFALPTAVAGIALTATWAPTGFLGRYLHAIGIEGAYSRVGVVIALTFIGLPFVVRTVQPVLATLDPRTDQVVQDDPPPGGEVVELVAEDEVPLVPGAVEQGGPAVDVVQVFQQRTHRRDADAAGD